MDKFGNIINKVISATSMVGALSLCVLMIIVVANIISRAAGGVILGAHELIQLIIVITVACSFAYASLEGSHIIIRMFIDRLSQFPKSIMFIFTSFVSFAVIAAIVWANILVLKTRWFLEYTDIFEIPWLPFRFILVIGLALFGIALLLDIYKGIRAIKG